MDVDRAPLSLKRSSSAPVINRITATMNATSTSASAPRDSPSGFNLFSGSPRARRFSTSSSTTGAPRLTPRVSQLRQEECVDVAGREAAHEREIHSAMQISQSWEDLTIEAEGLSFRDAESSASLQLKIERQPSKRSLDPLAVSLANGAGPGYSSPSPTRCTLAQRQCYSPSVVSWKSNLSPSPTRKAFATRRSLSPIAIRPSCLGNVKRKFELEDSLAEQKLQPPAKRPSGIVKSAACRLDGTVSSPQDSPGFSFRPVDSPTTEELVQEVVPEAVTQENPTENHRREHSLGPTVSCSRKD